MLECVAMSLTVNNIQASFRCTGIFPYNRNVFTSLNFAPSFVTNRLLDLTNDNERSTNDEVTIRTENIVNQDNHECVPSTSPGLPNNEFLDTPTTILQTEEINNEEFTPEAVRPFLKAVLRKELRRGRKKRKSTVYTETSEIAKIKTEYEKNKM